MSAAPGITVDPASAVPTSPCRLCATEASFAFDVRGQRLYRCGDCGYLQVAPVPSDAELAEIYGG